MTRESTSYELVSRQPETERSTVRVGDVEIGPRTATLVAGPYVVESPEQALEAARMAQQAGAVLLRGGARSSRPSPSASPGLGEAGLRILADVRAETGLPIVTEVAAAADVDVVVEHADMLHVHARAMQDVELLRAVGSAGRPVLLERGPTATVEEWLMAAERIAQRGNLSIVLCERGARTVGAATRDLFDISAVPVVQALSHLPVLVDPSHCGRRDLVLPLSRAALAVGADGLVVDVHPDPTTAPGEGSQALVEDDLPYLADALQELGRYMGRTITRAWPRAA